MSAARSVTRSPHGWTARPPATSARRPDDPDPARRPSATSAPSPNRPSDPAPPALHLDALVALGAQGRYHSAVRRLASLCDRAAAEGPQSLDRLDAAVAAALERASVAGGDAHRLSLLGSLAAGQLRAVRHRTALHGLGPARGGDSRHRLRTHGRPLPVDTPRRVLSRRRSDVSLVVATVS